MSKLTARVAIKTLGEHFLAFLAANNLSGFVKGDQEITDATIGGSLMLLALTPQHTGLELKASVKHLIAISDGVLNKARAEVLVQMAIGIKYSKCRHQWSDDEIFVTDWERGLKNTQVFRAKHDGEGIRDKTRAATVGLRLLTKLTVEEKRALPLVLFSAATVEELLSDLSKERYLTQETLKRAVYQMRVIEGNGLKVHACYHQIANALGYPEYNHMRLIMHHDVIANLKHPENKQSLITEFSDEE